MKKQLLILILFCFGMRSAFAQDLIVTTSNDTLNCKITNITDDFVFFYFQPSGKTIKARAKRSTVKEYQTDYFDVPEITDPKALRATMMPHHSVRFSANGGWNFRLAKMSPSVTGDYRDFTRKLTNGPQYGGSVKFLIQDILTLGLHYNQYQRSNSMDVYTEIDNEYVFGTLNEEVRITFIGASGGLFAYVSENNRHAISFGYLVGCLKYLDEGNLFEVPFKIEGKSFGFGFEVNYDYFLTKHLAVGAETSLMFGAARHLTVTEGSHVSAVDLADSGALESLRKLNFCLNVSLFL